MLIIDQVRLPGDDYIDRMFNGPMVGPFHQDITDSVHAWIDYLLENIPVWSVRDQDAYEQAKVLEGRVLYLNNRLVHDWDCHTIRHKPDDPSYIWSVHREWLEWVQEDVEGYLRGARISGPRSGIVKRLRTVPEMPRLLTAAEVGALKSYRACEICQPILAQRVKSAARSSIALMNLKSERIGRRYVGDDGRSLGRLKSIRVIAEFEKETLEGCETRVELAD